MSLAPLVNLIPQPDVFAPPAEHALHWWAPGLLLLMLGISAYGASNQSSADQWGLLLIFLLLNAAAILPCCLIALSLGPDQVLSNHILVLAVFYALYFIGGGLLLPLGSTEEVDYALTYYNASPAAALEVAGLNALGMGVAMLASEFAPRNTFLRIAGTASNFGERIPFGWTVLIFVVIGAVAYINVLSFDWDPQVDMVTPGIWRSLSNLLLAAIFLLAAFEGPNRRMAQLIAITLTCVMGCIGLIILNKTQALLPLVALFAGIGRRTGFKPLAVPATILLLGIFLLISGPINTVRNIYGASSYISFENRLNGLIGGLKNSAVKSVETDYYPWARFCYIPSQSAAVSLYRNGQGSSDYDNIPWVFVPRFLFPEKPILTSAGQNLHYDLTGFRNSSTGIGIFVDGFYNLGVVGVLLSGALTGLILGCTSAFAQGVLQRRVALLIPLALSGSYMAYRIDGYLLGDFIGPFVQLLYFFVIAILFKAVVRAERWA